MNFFKHFVGIYFFFSTLSAYAAATHTVTWGTGIGQVTMTCKNNGPLFVECIQTDFLSSRVGEAQTLYVWTDVLIQNTPATSVCVRYSASSHQCMTISTAGCCGLNFTNAGYPADTDHDLWMNNYDTDDDNDGVPDINDAFPLDVREWLDTDHDGFGNNADWDDDGDGVPDTVDAAPLDAANSSEVTLPLNGAYRGIWFNDSYSAY